MLKIHWKGDGLEKMAKAIKVLGEAKAQSAYRMALNDTRKKVFTVVKRVVAKQMGVTQAAVVKHGGIRQVPASSGKLVTSIDSTGTYLPLKDFKPKQGRAGVSAAPWGGRHTFPGTFMAARAGGHVFKSTGKFNSKSGRFNAIESLWGPSVPKELVKDESAKAFTAAAEKDLPAQISRQLKRLSGGTIS